MTGHNICFILNTGGEVNKKKKEKKRFKLIVFVPAYLGALYAIQAHKAPARALQRGEKF